MLKVAMKEEAMNLKERREMFAGMKVKGQML